MRPATTLVDGEALTTAGELFQLGVLRLEKVQQLDGSYVRLKYKVIS